MRSFDIVIETSPVSLAEHLLQTWLASTLEGTQDITEAWEVLRTSALMNGTAMRSASIAISGEPGKQLITVLVLSPELGSKQSKRWSRITIR